MTDDFQTFFLDGALPLAGSQEGLQRATVVLPLDGNPNEFLTISEWDNLESPKKFAGEEWDKTIIDPREAHLCRPEQHKEGNELRFLAVSAKFSGCHAAPDCRKVRHE